MGKQLIEGASRRDVFMMDPSRVVVIGVDTRHKSHQEHRLYDQRVHTVWKVLPDETVRNIMDIGVLVPVLVEVDELDGKEAVVVYDGRGRVLMTREANRRLAEKGLPPKSLPVIATRANSGNVALHDLAVIAANEHRQEDTAFNRAEKARYLLETGHDEAVVAGMFRVSVQAVKGWLSLLDLCPKVRKAVEAGKISASAASGWAKLDRDAQEERLEKLLAKAEGGTKPTKKAAEAAERGFSTPGKKDLRRVSEHLQGLTDSGLGGADYTAGFRDALGWVLGQAPAAPPVKSLLDAE